jgi:hypothetical protein
MNKFNAGKASGLVLSAVFAFVLFLFSGQSVMAVVNSVTPSTNDINRTNSWAHVDQLSQGVGTTDLQFISTRPFLSCFEYRTDGDTSQVSGNPNYNTLITDGLYPFTCRNNNTSTKTITANEYVEVRMVFGAETDERFDWTRFEVDPAPAPEPTPLVCTGDTHPDGAGTSCVSFSPSGPAPRNDEGTGGQVLGTSTAGQVLGATTLAKTGTFTENAYLAIMGVGATLSAFGFKNLKKAFQKA